MAWHQPFDLFYWWVNVFAGSLNMFLAIAFLIIAMLSGMFRFPTMITGIMFALFIVMLSAALSVTSFYILVLFILALIVGWSLARLLK